MPAVLGTTVSADLRAPASAVDGLLLVVADGYLAIRPVAPGRAIVFGRHASSDVIIDSSQVSRRHAVVRGGTPPTVEDAGSKNGVRIDGRRLGPRERYPLAMGTSFQVGPATAVLLPASAGVTASDGGRTALVVNDPREDALSELVVRVARSDINVLIAGETGVGKDVLARALHARSERAGALLTVNCAALPEPLLESELFGHERGAFTGAVHTKVGLFEAADGGTVFLDEIGEMPLGVQAKLLRAIEARQVVRVGGSQPIALDVRFVAATHRDLRAAVASGGFRKDLYFRLNGITLSIPPLRERRGLIPVLAEQFIADASARATRKPPALTVSALSLLTDHDWPGNIRELRAVIQRAMLLAGDADIREHHVCIDPPISEPTAHEDAAPRTAIARAERDRIVTALEQCDGNQSSAAKLLGVSRSTLVNKIVAHRIPRPRIG